MKQKVKNYFNPRNAKTKPGYKVVVVLIFVFLALDIILIPIATSRETNRLLKQIETETVYAKKWAEEDMAKAVELIQAGKYDEAAGKLDVVAFDYKTPEALAHQRFAEVMIARQGGTMSAAEQLEWLTEEQSGYKLIRTAKYGKIRTEAEPGVLKAEITKDSPLYAEYTALRRTIEGEKTADEANATAAEAAKLKDLSKKLPYIGMSSKYIDSTLLGAHENDAEWEDDNGNSYYEWYVDDDCACEVVVRNGKVVQLYKFEEDRFWTDEGMPYMTTPGDITTWTERPSGDEPSGDAAADTENPVAREEPDPDNDTDPESYSSADEYAKDNWKAFLGGDYSNWYGEWKEFFSDAYDRAEDFLDDWFDSVDDESMKSAYEAAKQFWRKTLGE